MTSTPSPADARRPLAARNLRFFQRLATALARAGVTPNGISAASMLFGCAAGACFWLTSSVAAGPARLCWLGAAVFIQLRLLANMLDGMVAVEGRKGGPTGELWNEAPDRVSDVAILLGAGYAAGSSPLLGAIASIAAVFVAYVRALGASAGAGQVFSGPMAKPQRMFWLTLVALFFVAKPSFGAGMVAVSEKAIAVILLVGAFVDVKTGFRGALISKLMLVPLVLVALLFRETLVGNWTSPEMPIALVAITVGCIFTSLVRILEIAKKLRTRAATPAS